jgi:hypothetical protein
MSLPVYLLRLGRFCARLTPTRTRDIGKGLLLVILLNAAPGHATPARRSGAIDESPPATGASGQVAPTGSSPGQASAAPGAAGVPGAAPSTGKRLSPQDRERLREQIRRHGRDVYGAAPSRPRSR